MMEEYARGLEKHPNNVELKRSYQVWKQTIRGNVYRGESKKCVADLSPIVEQDKETLYRVTYGRYNHYYIGHYSSEKYQLQMQDYKMHKRKSRPNGRKWCHLQSDSCHLYPNQPSRREFYLDSLPKGCLIAYCDIIKHRIKKGDYWSPTID